jgi:hypothetical protein
MKFKLKPDTLYNIILGLIIIALVISYIFIFKRRASQKLEMMENSDQPYTLNEDGSKNFLDPKNAREACEIVSTRAEEIAAQYAGEAELAIAEAEKIRAGKSGFWNSLDNAVNKVGESLNDLTSAFNPESWGDAFRSGDNVSKTMTRNVINTDLSVEDRKKISEKCEQIASTSQENIISVNTDDCPYCIEVIRLKADLMTKGIDSTGISECSVKNVRQSNTNKSNQLCTIQTTIEVLREKKNSIDAQALAQVLQRAQDPLSGSNRAESQNCNVVSTDMSSKSYFEKNFECNQIATTDQRNVVEGCSLFQNIIQSNNNEIYQDCMNVLGEKTTEKTESEQKIKGILDITQYAEGLSPFASLGSIFSSVLCCLIVFGTVLYVATDPGVQKTVVAMKQH